MSLASRLRLASALPFDRPTFNDDDDDDDDDSDRQRQRHWRLKATVSAPDVNLADQVETNAAAERVNFGQDDIFLRFSKNRMISLICMGRNQKRPVFPVKKHVSDPRQIQIITVQTRAKHESDTAQQLTSLGRNLATVKTPPPKRPAGLPETDPISSTND